VTKHWSRDIYELRRDNSQNGRQTTQMSEPNFLERGLIHDKLLFPFGLNRRRAPAFRAGENL